MSKNIFISIIALMLFGSVQAAFIVDIQTEVTNIGEGRWEYTYEIENSASSTENVEWLTIWFDYEDYSNFEITTVNSGLWNEAIIQPEPLTLSGAGYDLDGTSSPLAPGQTVTGFSIAFDYNGEGIPGLAQEFEIINPQTWETLYTGTTVPEPATLVLLSGGLAAIALRKKR